MKIILLIVVIVCTVATEAAFVVAEDSSIVSRKIWVEMNSRDRTMYLNGLSDGINTVKQMPHFTNIPFRGTTIFDMRQYMDSFYDNVANQVIPTTVVLFLMTEEMQGLSFAAKQGYMESLRAMTQQEMLAQLQEAVEAYQQSLNASNQMPMPNNFFDDNLIEN